MTNKIIKFDSKKVLLIIFLNIISFYILYKLSIIIAHNTNFYELVIVKDIVGINVIVGLISIFSFFLYSYLYDDNYFHMFSLMYISIYFEFIIITFFGKNLNVLQLADENSIYLGASSIFRTFIIWLTFYEHNSINRYLLNNKIYSIFLSMFLTLFCIFTDIFFMKNNIINSHIMLIKFIKFTINILTYIVLIKLCLQYLKNKNRNYIITFIGTYVMFLSRMLLVVDLYPNRYSMYFLNRVILSIGFSIIIIGMFWEIIMRNKENRLLVTEFNTQKIEIDRLKQEEELRTQFFANISHELRTPLNILICSFQLLKSKNDNKNTLFDYYKKYEDTITTNSSRMLRLINNIIDASKFDTGYFKMNFMNFDIINLVEEITLSIAKSEKAQNRNIIFDTNIEYLEIKCDPENIERVILNLLSNAVKFTENNGNIKVTCELTSDYLIIKVKDDGIGVPHEFRRRIFDRFVQVDKSFRRNNEGSGIGLSIVKFIVDSHGGEIYLNEKVAEGCEFIVKLPNILIDSEEKLICYTKSTQNELDSKVSIELSDID